MQRLIFWLAYPFLRLISFLPFGLFYIFSDFVHVIVYYVVGYRRKTVKTNLNLTFPKMAPEEKKRIEKKFYHHMVDMFLEMIKSISISEDELKKRFVFTNLEEIEKIKGMQKSIILVCGHYASFEWMNALQLHERDYKGFGIYKKIENKYFDQLAKDIRGRFNAILIPTKKATKTITENEKNDILGIYGMVADQSPKPTRARGWTDFMGIQVPVFMGTEKLSKNLNMAVVYLHVEKIKRGYYQATFKSITYSPAQEPPFFITKKYLELLESQIKKAPEYYLWTHKRWKHRNKPVPKNTPVF